jgi:CDP-glycerol glycerophosphotransferase
MDTKKVMNLNLIILIIRGLMKPLLKLLRIVIKDDSLVLLMHHHIQGYGGNPKYIANALYRLNPHLRYVWLSTSSDLPPWIQIHKPSLFNIIYYHTKAKVWIDDEVKPRYLSKFRDQYYIQTWHGDRGFKLIKYQYQIKPLYMIEEKKCDAFVCGSTHSVKKYPIAFKTNAKMILKGMPGNDRFVKGLSNSHDLKQKHGISDKMLCLIAPTLTNLNDHYMSQVRIAILKETLESVTHKSWVVAFRSHYRNQSSLSLEMIQNNQDIYDVLEMCDLLISDYSSLIGDYCVQNKPWVIYTPHSIIERPTHDKLQQIKYFKYDHFDDLINQVGHLFTQDFKIINKNVLNAYGAYESGEASEFIAKTILEHL